MKRKKLLLSLTAALAISTMSLTAFAATSEPNSIKDSSAVSSLSTDQGSNFCGGYGRFSDNDNGNYNCWN